ncbi:hypothetical protein CC1G_07003 [Coprinopsis cinerea okayama7|uniref:Uncharacterized protein n=1 Tax=Coprinopsis cinerea (strain Okayama-7 / 130 / ATCC MYA-4618 / FGSC 9003) TaxID=240176 RepID=A8NAV0_COPC7|nr:hypothetical protein CC1G_07003 [Coprinopsis cinerea okayama7\|eukprot:XP_001831952.2 hypothetical protein CC1G_07003 [Coprinopsis cinerea okayama7\
MTNTRPKRRRRLTKRARDAVDAGIMPDLGAVGDSDESVSDASQSGSDSEPPPTQDMASASSTPTTAPVNPSTASKDAARLSRFAARYKTETRTDEEVLAAQRNAWTSRCYDHFDSPTIKREGDKVWYIFTCKAVSITRARHDESTGNLKRHVDKCVPADSSEVQAMATFTAGHKFNKLRHRVLLAIWVAKQRRPFSIVEDPELLQIFKELNTLVETPSRNMVSRDVREIFTITREALKKSLQDYPGRLNLAADGWTSPNVISFLGVTVHRLKDASINATLLDFIKLKKAHTGQYLASKLMECLHEFGIADKILAFTGDNASNNDTMLEELKELMPSFRGPEVQVRCFAHILNLVVKSVMSPFAKAKRGPNDDVDPEVDNPAEEDSQSTAHPDVEVPPSEDQDGDDDDDVSDDDDDDDGEFEVPEGLIESDQREVSDLVREIEADFVSRLDPLSAADAKVAQSSITKLRKLAIKIVHSPTISEDLKACCERVGVFAKKMVRDVPTRWNSTAELLDRALELRAALDRLCLMPEHNRSRGARLKQYRLSPDEWKVLEQLAPLLDGILYATKEVSKSSIPLIHEVIPFIDSLTSMFDEFIDNTERHPAVRHAALRGLKMLNKYYSKTDKSIVYRIAMILHPGYKTNYFMTAKWEPEWIVAAKAIARDEWVTYYKSAITPASSTSTPVSSSSATAGNDKDGRFAVTRKHFTLVHSHAGGWSSTCTYGFGLSHYTGCVY